MSDTNKFQEAKRRLSDLSAESDNLPRALAGALTAGNAEEVSALRQRQKELPNRILEAELDLSGMKVGRLRAAQAERRRLLVQEQATSKETDAIVASRIAELNADIKKLKDEAHA